MEKQKKLKINRGLVRKLRDAELKEIPGGNMTSAGTDCVTNWCQPPVVGSDE